MYYTISPKLQLKHGTKWCLDIKSFTTGQHFDQVSFDQPYADIFSYTSPGLEDGLNTLEKIST